MRKFRITVEGTTYDVTVEELDDAGAAAPSAGPAVRPAAPAPAAPPPPSAPAAVSTPAPQNAPSAPAGPGDVVSPLAGTVQKLDVAVGDQVGEGQSVVTLEAMKMLTTVPAPRPGKVTEIRVQPGTSVQEGQVLVVLG